MLMQFCLFWDYKSPKNTFANSMVEHFDVLLWCQAFQSTLSEVYIGVRQIVQNQRTSDENVY